MERRQFINFFVASAGCSIWGATPLLLRAQQATQFTKLEGSKLQAPVKVCLQCESILEGIDDYQAVFIKRELINGRIHQSIMDVKVRHDPFSVYMYFRNPSEGREVIFVEGRNDGELLVHETGLKSLAGTISLDPYGSMALKESHYPIVDFGLKKLASELAELWTKEAHNENVEVKYYPNAKVGKIACKAIEVIHPQKIAGIDFHITRFYIDAKTFIPVRLQHYLFPKRRGGEPVLYEEYTYLDFKPNRNLQEIDFSVENPKYNY